MSPQKLTIGFVRRGYSASGGAEAYLKRLGRGVVDAGHNVHLLATNDWPQDAWTFGAITRLHSGSTITFADEVEELRPQVRCDVLMSLERVWRCDVYRAGDGVHRAWLERREKFATPVGKFFRRFNRKHDDILRLENSLLAERGAARVIVNSRMVQNEIVDLYGYPSDKIDIVPNGVPIAEFREAIAKREQGRAALGLAPDEIAVLFVGSGWERKGLSFAIEAVEAGNDPKMRLFVAGRGNRRRYKSARAQFLGTVVDLAQLYAAADIFLLPTIYDPFSNACLEALASGIPVITTRANGFSEIIEDGVHGSIIDLSDNGAALCGALKFWSDETRRRAARSTIIGRASQFDISKNVAQTLQILVQAAASAALTSGKIPNT
jgi:UDP-glucose:(heptosyl)LPS alpha-1,3-glucosyltransferase